MKILSFLIVTPLLLFCVDPSIPSTPPLDPQHIHSLAEDSKKIFIYLSPGATTLVPLLFTIKPRDLITKEALYWVLPDLSLGMRTLSSHHVFDGAIGMLVFHSKPLLYVQGSYLLFPNPSKGIYFGAGLTCGFVRAIDIRPAYLNIPITLGYQFPLGKSFQFIQIQGTPIGTGTISYGVGF